MRLEKFNKKHGKKGGMARLTELRAMCYTQAYIASQFNVSTITVSNWMKEFFGSNYDPRQDRKEVIISSMIDFARHHKKEEFQFAFGWSENDNNLKMEYYKEALQKCIDEGIYDSE